MRIKCKYFTGLTKIDCDAGVHYQDVWNGAAELRREQYPCFIEGKHLPCEARHFPTEEEVRQALEASLEKSARMTVAMVAAKKDAAENGFKKGKGGQGQLPCPCCEGGILRYSVAAINGHMLARCSTPDCCAWME